MFGDYLVKKIFVSDVMDRIRLDISYDGTCYGGFQIQRNAPTIQEELEKALALVYKKPLRITGAGRTDAGVHARGQTVHFDAPFKIPAGRLPAALNTRLPSDIVVFKATPVDLDFHARSSALRKIYSYTVDRAPYPRVMLRRYAYHFSGPLNREAVVDAAHLLTGMHDFKFFQVSGSPKQSTVRTLYRVEMEEYDDSKTLLFVFEGSGFLYRMARLLTGSLLRVGRGKLGAPDIAAALEGRKQDAAGPTAPPQGLCLEKVIY